MTFAEKLKAARLEKGVSQTEVANAVGVKQSFIAHLEKGRKTPSTAVLVDLAKYYDVSLDYLLGDN